jgi:hypothetical protein
LNRKIDKSDQNPTHKTGINTLRTDKEVITGAMEDWAGERSIVVEFEPKPPESLSIYRGTAH